MEWQETRRRFRRLFLEPSTVGDIRSSRGSEGDFKKIRVKRNHVRDTEVVEKISIGASQCKRLPLGNVVVTGTSASVLVTCVHLLFSRD